MEQRSPDIFITKFRRKISKDGREFFIGNWGLMELTLWRHKTNEGEWNLKGRQAEDRRENKSQTQAPEFTDEIPF